jgi:glycine/D-amino acid oxidase-like deaminating enzyme
VTQNRRGFALARLFGVDCRAISPAEAAGYWPELLIDDFARALLMPGDRRLEPAQRAT